MKKSLIVAGAMALAIVAGPMQVAQLQARSEGARQASRIKSDSRIYNTARPSPKKDPNCDNKLQKDSMAWMDYYHCYNRSR